MLLLVPVDVLAHDDGVDDDDAQHEDEREERQHVEGELPLLKPPYSRMTAIDLNTGEHRGGCRPATATATATTRGCAT